MCQWMRRYWWLLLLGGGSYIALAVRFPLLWGIWNAELAIGIWLALGYTSGEAFLMACFFGNAECIFWYWLIGEKIKAQRQKLSVRIKVEREQARREGISEALRHIWRHIQERAEPEQYTKHWIYRFLVSARRHRVLGVLAVLPLYAMMAAICMVPLLMFVVIAFVHLVKVPKGLVAILVGNTLKMLFSAYGLWPLIFELLRAAQAHLF